MTTESATPTLDPTVTATVTTDATEATVETVLVMPKEDGRGKFTPVPFSYTGTDGKDYTWAGRGPHPKQLKELMVSRNQTLVKVDGIWTWKDNAG